MGNGAGTRSTLARMSARRYGAAIPVTEAGVGRGAFADLFGRTLSDGEIAALAGARPGTAVEVRGYRNGGALLTVRGAGVAAQVSVARGNDGRPALGQMQAEYPTPRARAEALAGQVRLARSLGIAEIAAKVHGDIAANNWALMPQLGYDASVPRVAHELHVNRNFHAPQATIPAHLAGARTYYDLWHGDPQWLSSVVLNPDLTFDTRSGSVSSRRLAAYLRGTS